MDDVYQINVAKTEFREGYDTGDVDRLLSVFNPNEFTLTPKDGGETIQQRQRYFEVWNRDAAGNWTISLFINNADVREELNGFTSPWFLTEERQVATSS